MPQCEVLSWLPETRARARETEGGREREMGGGRARGRGRGGGGGEGEGEGEGEGGRGTGRGERRGKRRGERRAKARAREERKKVRQTGKFATKSRELPSTHGTLHDRSRSHVHVKEGFGQLPSLMSHSKPKSGGCTPKSTTLDLNIRTIGTLVIRIGFWGPLYEPTK